MPTLFLAAAAVLLARLFWRRIDPRMASLWTATVLGAFVVLSTEVLSAIHELTRAGVGAAWASLATALAIATVRWTAAGPELPPVRRSFARSLGEMSIGELIVAATATIAVLVLATALISPPNTWDALDYHLPRVVMWIQDRSVDLFPTADFARLISPPWAEYTMLHLDLLYGGDRLVNLVQATSAVGSALAVSVLAEDMGASPRAQAFAALVAIAVPEGVLEASGAMNAYAASFWIVTSAVFMLRFARSPTIANTIGVGTTVGLALLTKGTSFIILPPVLMALVWSGTTDVRKTLPARLPLIAVVILAINGAHWLREYHFTGSPLGLPFPDGGARLRFADDRVSVTGTISTFLRNLSLHFSTHSQKINDTIERTVRTLIRALGANPDDPANTWLETNFFDGYKMPPPGADRIEVFAGNPLHVLLAFVVVALVIADRKGRYSRPTKLLALGVSASFILFCAMLRWQVWGVRLELPVFIVGAAVIGAVLTPRLSPRILGACACVLFLVALNCALRNGLRALAPWSAHSILRTPRAIQYFSDHHEDVADRWIAAAERIRTSKCDSVGFDEAEGALYDYPLLALIGADTMERHVRYVGVANRSARLIGPTAEPPCLVACLGCEKDAERARPYTERFGSGEPFGGIVLFGDR